MKRRVLVTDTESLTFENGEARKVTVTNNSDGDITIQVSVTAGTVTVTPSDPVTLTGRRVLCVSSRSGGDRT